MSLITEKKHNFKKHNNSEVDSLGTSYDHLSVMQYSKTAFGINGSVTMDPKRSGVFQLGQRVGFTVIDAFQANELYRCKGMNCLNEMSVSLGYHIEMYATDKD